MTTEENIIRAGRRLRIVVIAVLAASVLIAAVLLRLIMPWARSVGSSGDTASALRTINILLTVIFLSVVPVGLYILMFGLKVVRFRQIPPPGTAVLVDTRVVTGRKALVRGRVIAVLGLLLVVIASVAAIYLPHRIRDLMHQKVKQRSAQPTAQPVDKTQE